MTANTLRFNNSIFETGLDDDMQNTIITFCEPSYSGISNDCDLYDIDYVIDALTMNKRPMNPETEADIIGRIDKVIEQLTTLQSHLDYVAIDKF